MQRTFNVLFFSAFLMLSAISDAQTYQEYKNICDSLYSLQKFDSSLLYAQKAEAELKKDSTENSRAYAYFLGQYYGFIYHALNNIPQEVYWYKQSLRIFDKLHDTLCTEYAETLVNYSELITGFGAFSEAEPYLLKAEVILRPYTEQLNSYGGTQNNLANVYSYTGRYAKAEGIYMDMLNLIKTVLKSNENDFSATLYGNLGIVYNKTNQWNRSVVNFTRACNILKKLDADKYRYYNYYFSLGLVYAFQEKADEASKIFKEVIDSLKEAKYFILHASALNGMGQVSRQKHKPDEAEAYYLAALNELQQDERGARIYTGVGANLALLYAENKPAKADSLYRALLQKFRDEKDRDQYNYLQVYAGFCTNLIKTGKLAEAGDSLQSLSRHLFQIIFRNFDGMPQDEKIRFVESLKSNFDLVYSLVASGKSPVSLKKLGLYNLLQSKEMILTNQTGLYEEVRHSNDTALAGAYHNWLAIQPILYKLYALPDEKKVLNTDSLEALAENYERKFSTGMTVSTMDDKGRLIERISNGLSLHEAAVEFVRFNFISAAKSQVKYGAFIIKPGETEPAFVLLCNEEQLKQFFKPEKGTAADANDLTKKIYRQGDRTLYTLLWRPMEPYLKNCKSIYYSPGGMINSISLPAISVGHDSLLSDRYSLYLTADLKNIAGKEIAGKAIPKAASIWGKMDYDKTANNSAAYAATEKNSAAIDKGILPEDTKGGGFNKHWNAITDDETDKLKSIFLEKKIPVATYISGDATEEHFKELANGCKGILHISTHGFFAPADSSLRIAGPSSNMFTSNINPLLRCGLVFSGANNTTEGNNTMQVKEDGILTGYEIAQMDLSKVDLVVLSACETGLGDISAGEEGVMGLQRAFRLAGAKKLVVSLWRVPQKQTSELMVLFYKKLLSGIKAPEALLASQKELRNKKYPPFYWAGFVLIE